MKNKELNMQQEISTTAELPVKQERKNCAAVTPKIETTVIVIKVSGVNFCILLDYILRGTFKGIVKSLRDLDLKSLVNDHLFNCL